jgi:hypothetical protein
MESIIEQLCEVDREITKLVTKRNLLVEKANEIKELYQRGKILSDLLYKASTFQDPDESLCYIIRFILPMKDFMPIEHFPCSVSMLSQPLDGEWTRDSASRFLVTTSDALERDRVAIVVD